MKINRKFLRLCVVCKEYKTKEELIRITREYKSGKAVINNENEVEGRSVYVCREKECIEKLMKNKKGLPMLKLPIDDKMRTDIKRYIKFPEQN